jgi:hypothetical protein
VVKVLTYQDQLVFWRSLPVFIIQGETLTTEVKDVAFRALLEPEDTLGPKY